MDDGDFILYYEQVGIIVGLPTSLCSTKGAKVRLSVYGFYFEKNERDSVRDGNE